MALSPVTGLGTIYVSNSLSLKSVMYALNFAWSLFVHWSITKTLMSRFFNDSFFVLEEPHMIRQIGGGFKHDGLY